MKYIIVIILILFLTPVVLAQTILQSGETTFTIESIAPQPVDIEGNLVGLTGDLNYLNVFWSANYISGIKKDMGVRCYLNCDAGENITANCIGKENCTYFGPSGKGTCTIIKPNYNFKSSNNVVCNFYDPESIIPPESYKPYINRIFKPIDFEIISSKVAITLGEPFLFPITIRNLGLFTDDYNINTTTFSPNLVSIVRELITTYKIKTKEIVTVYPMITILSSISPARIGIWAYSINEKSPTCSAKEDCSYMEESYDCETVSKKCARYYLVDVKARVVALPEFDWFGVIQIMLLATIIFVTINLKKLYR